MSGASESEFRGSPEFVIMAWIIFLTAILAFVASCEAITRGISNNLSHRNCACQKAAAEPAK